MANLDGPGGSAWAEQDEQDLRPYVLTGGRTRSRHTMRLVSLLGVGDTPPPEPLAPEVHRALQVCRGGPRSVAEIAATIQQPVQVTKIILSDLIDCGALIFPVAACYDQASDPGTRIPILEAVLDGLQKL